MAKLLEVLTHLHWPLRAGVFSSSSHALLEGVRPSQLVREGVGSSRSAKIGPKKSGKLTCGGSFTSKKFPAVSYTPCGNARKQTAMRKMGEISQKKT
jgi:hypothetical protein